MNATELLNADGTPSGVWVCGKCRGTPSRYAHPECAYTTRRGAEQCCQTLCRECDKVLDVKYKRYAIVYCEACNASKEARWRAKDAEIEEQRLAEAEDVTGTYTGMLYRDGTYLESVAAVLEHFQGREVPEYVFACTERVEELDLDQAIADVCRGGYEGMGLCVSEPSEELRAEVAKWNQQNRQALTTHDWDCQKKVRIRYSDGNIVGDE